MKFVVSGRMLPVIVEFRKKYLGTEEPLEEGFGGVGVGIGLDSAAAVDLKKEERKSSANLEE